MKQLIILSILIGLLISVTSFFLLDLDFERQLKQDEKTNSNNFYDFLHNIQQKVECSRNCSYPNSHPLAYISRVYALSIALGIVSGIFFFMVFEPKKLLDKVKKIKKSRDKWRDKCEDLK